MCPDRIAEQCENMDLEEPIHNGFFAGSFDKKLELRLSHDTNG
jgi:hypothetical protein